MRLFVAVSLPEEIKTGLESILRKFSGAAERAGADIKWVRPDHLHFTLKFLGEFPETRLEKLTAALALAVRDIRPFSISPGGLGYFPPAGAIKILWLGLLKGSESLGDLARRVEAACGEMGVQRDERDFSAHLTLGRARSTRHMDEIRSWIEKQSREPLGDVEVRSVALIRSVLSSNGPTYTVLKTFSFG